MSKIVYPRFRAWYKGKKDSYGDSNYDIPSHMIYDVQRIYDGLDPKLDPHEVCGGLGSFGQLLSYEDENGENPFIVMQHTKLKDAQGEDIWEGDILGLLDFKGDDSRCHIIFEPPAFVKFFSKSYSPDLGEDFTTPIDGWDLEHWVVIGNIYENKELICANTDKDSAENQKD